MTRVSFVSAAAYLNSMRRFVAVTVTLAALASATLGSAAFAADRTCVAPPGNSAVEQYCEAVPSAGGGSKPKASHGVDGATAQRLSRAGKDGAAVLKLAKSAPKPSKAKADGTTSSGQARPVPAGDPLRAVKSSISGGDTVGSGFIWALVAVAAAAVGLGWIGLRRRPGPPAQ